MNNANQNAVEVENLEKKFGNFIAVDRVSFRIKQGEIFGFLGPNGAGKSTTIRMLCGIIAPTSGRGRVSGYDIIREQERIKQNIGYMSQRFSLYDDLTVEENINFYSGIYRISPARRKERKEQIIAMAGLAELRTRRTGVLSGGWKQRLALGCAILHEPAVVFLDEPTSGVDPLSRKTFWNIIKAMSKNRVTVFITTHYMDEAENCDRLALMYNGGLIAVGSPLELKTKFMKEEVLQITLPRAEDWLGRLKSIPEVKETALFGTALHAVAADAQRAIASLKDFFLKEKMRDYRVEKIQPTLEDVFVSLIEQYDRNV